MTHAIDIAYCIVAGLLSIVLIALIIAGYARDDKKYKRKRKKD